MSEQDGRWKQRFNSYIKALRQVEGAVKLFEERGLSELERQGIIQAFQYTYELAWRLLQDYLKAQGFTQLIGPKDSVRQAFAAELIIDGAVWMDMIDKRALTSQAYNPKLAAELQDLIVQSFFPAFKDLEKTFTNYYETAG